MTPAVAHPRTSAAVEAQLKALDAVVKDSSPPSVGDRAAELRWESWQTHRAELEEELAQARRLEGAIAQAEIRIPVQSLSSAGALTWLKLQDFFVRLFEGPKRRDKTLFTRSGADEAAADHREQR